MGPLRTANDETVEPLNVFDDSKVKFQTKKARNHLTNPNHKNLGKVWELRNAED